MQLSRHSTLPRGRAPLLPTEHSQAECPRQRHAEQDPPKLQANDELDGRHPADRSSTADQCADGCAQAMLTERGRRQGDSECSGCDDVAAHDPEHLREPCTRTRSDDFSFRGGKVNRCPQEAEQGQSSMKYSLIATSVTPATVRMIEDSGQDPLAVFMMESPGPKRTAAKAIPR